MNADGISWDFFYEACEALGATGAKAFPTIHAEDPWVRDFLTERMRGRAGRNKLLQRWLEASPNILEPMQIYPRPCRARGRYAGPTSCTPAPGRAST